MARSNTSLMIPSNQTSQENQILNDAKTAGTIVFTLVFIIGVGGNSMVVYIFGVKKRRHRTTNELLLLSLGVCDLLCSIILPPVLFYTTVSVHSQAWYIFGCLLTPVLFAISITTSQVILIIICYDRYRAIVKPMEPKLCVYFIRSGVLSGIVMGFLICLPLYIQFDMGKEAQHLCVDFKYRKTEVVVQAMMLVLRDIISLTFMSYFIYRMVGALDAGEKFRKRSTATKDGKSFQRTKRILYAVIITFTVCILPGDVFHLVTSSVYFGTSLTVSQFRTVTSGMMFVKLLQISNSAANVFIYSAIHPDFQRMHKRIFTLLCLCRCQEKNHEDTSTVALSSNSQNMTSPSPQVKRDNSNLTSR